MKDSIAEQGDSPGRRAAAYWFSDGLPECIFGAAYLVWGVLGIVWRLDLLVHWGRLPMLAGLLGFSLVLGFDRKILEWLKVRLTYPRTGYVRPPAYPEPPGAVQTLMDAPPSDENVTSFHRFTVVVFFQAMILATMSREFWTVPVCMTIVAVLVYILNRREARQYPWWSVLPIALAGWLSLLVSLPLKIRPLLPILIGGAWLLSRGTWTLVHYLRAHTRPAAVEALSHE